MAIAKVIDKVVVQIDRSKSRAPDGWVVVPEDTVCGQIAHPGGFSNPVESFAESQERNLAELKRQASAIFSQYDWMFIRELRMGRAQQRGSVRPAKAVPDAIVDYLDAVQAEMERCESLILSATTAEDCNVVNAIWPKSGGHTGLRA